MIVTKWVLAFLLVAVVGLAGVVIWSGRPGGATPTASTIASAGPTTTWPRPPSGARTPTTLPDVYFGLCGTVPGDAGLSPVVVPGGGYSVAGNSTKYPLLEVELRRCLARYYGTG